MDRVDPGFSLERQSISVRIEGIGFRLPLENDLDEQNVTGGDIDVTVGGVSFLGVVLRSEQLIEATVRINSSGAQA